MSAAELEKKFGQLVKNREKVQELSPEQLQILIRSFKALPTDRQAAIKHLLHHSCGTCEKEMGLPNVGIGHGICDRHKAEMYKMMGKEMPKSQNTNPTKDLKDFSPDELKIAAYFSSLMLKKQKQGWNKSSSTV